MKFKNKILVFAGIAFALSHMANAEDKLPFVGKKSFNFDGGNGTGQTIIIERDGSALIQLHGSVRTSDVFKGKYAKHMVINASKGYEYFIKGNEICVAQKGFDTSCTKMYHVPYKVTGKYNLKDLGFDDYDAQQFFAKKSVNELTIHEMCSFWGEKYMNEGEIAPQDKPKLEAFNAICFGKY